jgi:hypothetical protein
MKASEKSADATDSKNRSIDKSETDKQTDKKSSASKKQSSNKVHVNLPVSIQISANQADLKKVNEEECASS